ncbi:uncharacterized protein [Montipora capricornis]|uniref:uncharacterized protein n=1 Tax=Montipora capricornis TaxID=246305 RepID=UPI0035F1F650
MKDCQLEHVLMFITGADRVPPLGFGKPITIAFYDQDGEKRRPSSSTCNVVALKQQTKQEHPEHEKKKEHQKQEQVEQAMQERQEPLGTETETSGTSRAEPTSEAGTSGEEEGEGAAEATTSSSPDNISSSFSTSEDSEEASSGGGA